MRGHDLDDDLALAFRWMLGIGVAAPILSWILVVTVWPGLVGTLLEQLIIGGGTLAGVALGGYVGQQMVRARYRREGIDV